MCASFHNHPHESEGLDEPIWQQPGYRRVLWAACLINLVMFFVEFISGLEAASMALQADALDFLGDTLAYALALAIIGVSGVWRARVALFKATTITVWGIYVVVEALARLRGGTLPEASTMGLVGFLALCANLAVTAMLFRYRRGDASMLSIWLCSRNDAIGNLAVMGAALGVFGTATAYPDLLVAGLMGLLAVWTGGRLVRIALAEIRTAGHLL